MSLPELQQNPLVQRVIDIFDQDGNGEVDFKGIAIHIFAAMSYQFLKTNLFLQSSSKEFHSSVLRGTKNQSYALPFASMTWTMMEPFPMGSCSR